MAKMTNKCTFWVSESLKNKLQLMADDDSRSLSDYIRIVLGNHAEANFMSNEQTLFAAKQERIKKISQAIDRES
jgi:hypothetical protein